MAGTQEPAEEGDPSAGSCASPSACRSTNEARKQRRSVAVAKLDSSSAMFTSSACPLWSLSFGPDVDPFILHLFAALAEKEPAMISTRTKAALRLRSSAVRSSADIGARRSPNRCGPRPSLP
jgi:hypothetical protein